MGSACASEFAFLWCATIKQQVKMIDSISTQFQFQIHTWSFQNEMIPPYSTWTKAGKLQGVNVEEWSLNKKSPQTRYKDKTYTY